MAANYGAHEVMELHEVLTDTIDGINQFQLYRPHITDSELRSILDHQIQFMSQDYNQMVQAINQKGMGQATPYRAPKTQPVYGLNNPQPQSPNTDMNEMDDRDVASGMLGCHKASATMRMHAALECADPQLRRMMQQGAINCSEQAYEVWQYMNDKGYYQVPTMKQMTTDTVIQSYNSTATGQQQLS
ncbi:MAG: spore coat protein [Novibacillus thermophilus]|jgi:spore coat protein CotF|uniref:Coat protein F n=1 Tax=Novibacillus thermophilus TaxID=1471761 RepID=A0A1U9K881_9BACL|nr:spore coat protein [Novibacillus thermophilus]AQS56230.1 coat protein F [Novibacillus thermophilus]